MYNQKGEVIPVSEEDLPVKLPDDINFNKAGNPLDHHSNWKNVKCKKTGELLTRETDTLDTFVDCLGIFKICSSDNNKEGFERRCKILDACRSIHWRLNMQCIYFTLDFSLGR